MSKFSLDKSSTRKLEAEGSRQPRAPLREAQLVQNLEPRDPSASSSERRRSRSSLFLMRPKSAMTTSSSEAGPGEQLKRSTTMETPIMPSKSDTSKGRFLFGRGRKSSKSSGSKVRANSPTDIYDDGYVPRHRESKHKRESSGDSRGASKDVFADFRTLRRGHRTAIIAPSRAPQVEERKAEPARPRKGPAPLRPKRSDECLTPEQLLAPKASGTQPLRQIRSAERFSPGIPPSQTAGPPKRPLHRPPPLNPAFFPPTANYNLAHLPNGSLNDEWDHLLPLYENRSPRLNPMDTTTGSMRPSALPDTAPDHVKSPMFHPPLEQVPEEPEGTWSDRQSKDITRESSIRHAKSSPMLSRNSSKSSYRKRSQTSPVQKFMDRPISQGSDTLGDVGTLSNQSHTSMDGPVEESCTRDRAPSWEDDIDYCYEHAAEADCDFDWNNVSRFEDSDHDDLYADDGPHTYALMQKDISKDKRSPESTVSSNEGDGYHLPNRVYKVPSKDALPELEYRSSHSTSTNSVSLLTPSDHSSFPTSEGHNSQRFSGKDTAPSQLLYVERSESQMHQIYDDLLSKPEGAPPTVPPRSEFRTEKMALHNQTRKMVAVPLLPTPPPSADQSPVIPDEEPLRQDLHINTIVAALRKRMESPVSPEDPPPPPPKFPPSQYRGRSNTVGSVRPNAFDAHMGVHEPPEEWPLMLPRSTSETSVVTAIPISKSPTPLSGSPPDSKVPIPPGAATTDVPSAATRFPGPAFGTEYSDPPRSTSFSSSEPEQPYPYKLHRKATSDPASSKSHVRPSRSSYSLFPQPLKSPGAPSLKSAKSMHFPRALRSAPLHGSFPSKPLSRFEQFRYGGPAPPKQAGFKARQRAFQILP